VSGTADEELDAVAALELRLLDPAVRRDSAAVDALLHPDFREVGGSGAVWTREAIIAVLATEPAGPAVRATDVAARRVAADVVLVTYRAAGSLRSSLWVRGGERGWQILFHQGTPCS
jgi:ribonuclease HI